MSASACPFCGTSGAAARCPGCGRDPTLPRRVCPRCHEMTPQNERTCSHCGAGLGSDLSWKIPLIIGIFVAAFILSVILHLAM